MKVKMIMKNRSRRLRRRHKKTLFTFSFFRLCFNKKYVEVVINNFAMDLIISKWLRRQKCDRREKR